MRGVTTPLDVANALSKSLAKRVVVAEADGAEWDLFRPLRAPCALRLHTFDDDLGKHVRAPRRAGHRVGHRVGQRRAPGQARAGPACMGWGSELASRTCRAGPALRGVSSGRALVGAAGTQPAARLSNVSHRAPHARRAAPSLTCLSALCVRRAGSVPAVLFHMHEHHVHERHVHERHQARHLCAVRHSAAPARTCNREPSRPFALPGAQTFWHSSAHVLGEALEACFGVRLTIGPALEEGFYYDCYLGDDRSLGDAEKPVLEKKIEQARPRGKAGHA